MHLMQFSESRTGSSCPVYLLGPEVKSIMKYCSGRVNLNKSNRADYEPNQIIYPGVQLQKGVKKNKTHLKRSCIRMETLIPQIKCLRCLIDQMAGTW